MRVITGTARGVKLETVPGQDVRPTADRVKEGLFSAIHFELPGRTALDLFAGSGQLGIEALSRGASLCVFVDQDRRSQEVIKRNVQAAKVAERVRILQADALAYLARCRERFDFVFVDPPYHCGQYGEILAALAPVLAPGGKVLVEGERDLPLEESYGLLLKQKSYRYGKTVISLYQKGEE